MTNINSDKRLQLLRNKNSENNIDFFIGKQGVWKKSEFINTLKDGEQILARYKKDDATFDTLYGIAHIFGENDPKNYIEVFKSGINSEKYGNGMEVKNNQIETRITENGGLEYDTNTAVPNGAKGIGVKAGNNVNVDDKGISVKRDNQSIIKNANNNLEVGLIDCDSWDTTPTV